MKLAVLAIVLGVSAPYLEAGQAQRPGARPAGAVADRVADAYAEYLRAHLAEDDDDAEGAIAAYKRAILLDPAAAIIPADLADLYLREGRTSEAIAAAEQSLKLAPTNRDAHRVLGRVYAALAGDSMADSRGGQTARRTNLAKAIEHLEQAIDLADVTVDANQRLMLANLYIAVESYDKAIPILTTLVTEEPGWQEGPVLLAQAYSAAGRSDEAVKWLEEAAPDNPQLYAVLADFYARERRWTDSAAAYEEAVRALPRRIDLRVQMASSLLTAGSDADIVKARDVLREAVAMGGASERALYLLSQAERRAGDSQAAESAARRLIAQNNKNPRGYSSLAEALEDQRRYQPLVDALQPAMATFRTAPDSASALGLLLPHLGFAYLQLGQPDRAIAVFEEARKAVPGEPSLTAYLIQAQIAAKNYSEAAAVARTARVEDPDDLRLATLESLALRRSGKVDPGLAVLEDLVRRQSDESAAYLALARGYVDENRTAQAVKLLQDAQAKFPGETAIAFELGATFDKQKRYTESEAVFRQLIANEPDNAQALNYLGYMLAERGERLDESVDYLKRALVIDPENGSYLDSIGWAYFKDGKLDLALENMARAAGQLLTNSVVQDHYGDVLFKLGRYDDAIQAWNRALSGDGDGIVRGDVDKKIRSARQKLPKR